MTMSRKSPKYAERRSLWPPPTMNTNTPEPVVEADPINTTGPLTETQAKTLDSHSGGMSRCDA